MKYIIHRGITSSKIFDNSYEGIKKAFKSENSFGVEFDVRLTKDKKIVLSHNSLIGINVIESTSYSNIIKNKYLTTLDKVLSIETEKIFLIDIKTNKNYKMLANALIKELNKTKKKNIYLASFDKKIISYLKNKVNYKLGLISFSIPRFKKYDFLVLNNKTISNNKLKRNKIKEIFLWTINNDKELQETKKKFTNVNDYYLIINKHEN